MNQNFSAVRIHPMLQNFVRPSPHSKFSPSAADRWLEDGCSYSIQAAVGIEEIESEYSKEGTLAHSVCEATFFNLFYMKPFSNDLMIKRMMWEKGHPGAAAEMDMCANGYVDLITYWLRNKDVIGDVIWYGLEKGIPVFPEQGCFGTADCIIIGTKAAVIIDYKHGQGKVVQADTLQLRVYAAGIARHIQVPEGYRIHTVIYQPRIHPSPKEHSYSMEELGTFTNKIWRSIHKANQKDLQPVEGNHCYWCPASRTKNPAQKCSAILKKAEQVVAKRFESFLADMQTPVDRVGAPNTKRDQAIMQIILLYPIIKEAYERGIEEFGWRLSMNEAIPGVRQIQEFGKRTYVGESKEDTATLIREKFPQVEPFKLVPSEYKLKSITEIEKEYKLDLSIVTYKKATQKVEVLDDVAQKMLGNLMQYAYSISNGHGGQEE